MKDIRYADVSMRIDGDYKILNSSDYFDKKHGYAKDMFYESDLIKMQTLEHGECMCAELATSVRGIVSIKRVSDGYIILPLGINGELYQRLKNQQRIDPPYYDRRIPPEVVRAKIHFAEVVRIINEISCSVPAAYVVSEAPIIKLMAQELKNMRYRSATEIDPNIQTYVSQRDFSLLTAATVSTVASFSYDRLVAISLRSLPECAALSVVTQFCGSDDDRMQILMQKFTEEHYDLLMIQMLTESLGWRMICSFEGLDDAYLRIGFVFPTIKVDPGEVMVFCEMEPHQLEINLAKYELSILKAPN